MSDSKILKMYLDIIGGNVYYSAGDIVSINHGGTVDIYDSYSDMIYYIKIELKKAGAI